MNHRAERRSQRVSQLQTGEGSHERRKINALLSSASVCTAHDEMPGEGTM